MVGRSCSTRGQSRQWCSLLRLWSLHTQKPTAACRAAGMLDEPSITVMTHAFTANTVQCLAIVIPQLKVGRGQQSGTYSDRRSQPQATAQPVTFAISGRGAAIRGPTQIRGAVHKRDSQPVALSLRSTRSLIVARLLGFSGRHTRSISLLAGARHKPWHPRQ
jgi:hypothetical protein